MVNNKIEVKNFNCYYNHDHILKSLNINIIQNEILTIIGPANSGKTTFLKALNRMNDLNITYSYKGEIFLDKNSIFSMNMEKLRQRIGILFAIPLPLPMSIYENIVYAPKCLKIVNKKQDQDILVERSLKNAFLWNEVKDRLNLSAMKISGGQQQRLCIARTLAMNPEVILFDEPCSGLDHISTEKIETLMTELKYKYTILLVTNNVKQASRVGDKTAFFLNGELIEINQTDKFFISPKNKQTENYITGRYIIS
ncbi:MAG: phosphate ABC transporter ATP-binding protein [Endomicrobium sp.]|jgi:phosphate transport system ATP-binding protein|nr:phosphate ABC transporter ATP-binding protein [Endomicrobium sp.]